MTALAYQSTIAATPADADRPEPADLPLAASRPPDLRRRARLAATVPRRSRDALAAGAARAAVSLDAVLLAALAETLRAWAKSPSFALGFDGPADRPGARRVLVAERGDGGFADRAAAFEAQLAAEAGPASPAGAGGAGLPVSATGLCAGLAADLSAAPEAGGSGTPGVLRAACRDGADGLAVSWDVAADAVAPGLAEAAFGAFTALLGLLADRPEAWSWTDFDLTPAADRALVAQANATAAPVPELLLQDYVAQAAARDPLAVAVVDSRRSLTYGELQDYASRIGRRLRDDDAAPVRPGELVAIVMTKGWEQYAAVYGVLASGAAYLPVDPAVPPERLARLLARGRVRHVLTQAPLAERLAWPDGPARHLVDTEFETGDATPLPAAQQPGDLAYVIFTSGSTGEPKGVMVEHRGVVNLVTDVNARFRVQAGDRLFGISGLHFDASVYDVFGPAAAGATVVLPDPFERAQPDRWVEQVAAEAVTIWNSVPALMEMVVGQAEIRDGRPLASLRLAVLSGDWIPLTLPDRLRAQAPGVSVVGSGGPTETICWSLFYPVGAVDPAWTSIPYGRAISNQRYYIVDDRLRQRPVGATGQMAVASDVGLARGYWDDGERTAAQFVTLPETGERAYLTGDLGCYRPDGYLEIHGRDDFQVKIQGYRIELGEIEAALREHPGVEHAVVIAPAAGSGGVRRLQGFVTARGPAVPDPEELRAALRTRLPGYMVPAVVTVLDALPLTRNGKVDRLALAGGRDEGQPVPARDPATGAGPAGGPEPDSAPGPESALDRLIAAVVAEVLGLDQVERGDNFFKLGGDSLGGTRVVRRFQELTGVTLPLRTLFDRPRVCDLAAALAAGPDGAAAQAAAERLERVLDAALAGDASAT